MQASVIRVCVTGHRLGEEQIRAIYVRRSNVAVFGYTLTPKQTEWFVLGCNASQFVPYDARRPVIEQLKIPHGQVVAHRVAEVNEMGVGHHTGSPRSGMTKSYEGEPKQDVKVAR